MKRQALYSCLTCLPESKDDCQKGAGVCLACSYACHENHELVELYTKRNFTCDCGTPKMRSKCSLDEKTRDNTKNEYNQVCRSSREISSHNSPSPLASFQNYSGLYCTCHRPYPDPESANEDEMIQCVVCEDWFHSQHLDNTDMKPGAEFFEMVCGGCVAKAEFLKDYTGLCVQKVSSEAADESLNVSVTEEKPAEEAKQETEEAAPSAAKKAKLEESVAAESSSSSTVDEKCRRPKKNPGEYVKGALLWTTNWRQQLCTCAACLAMYRELRVEFLTDAEDTVTHYEEKGLQKQAAHDSDYERGMRELSGLDRVRQIDAITAYNKMKGRLKDYLNQFVANQQVVTESDIKRFFEQMKNEDQKDLMVHSNIPFNCR